MSFIFLSRDKIQKPTHKTNKIKKYKTYLSFFSLFVAPKYDRTVVIPNANSRVVLRLVGIGTKVWNFGWMLAKKSYVLGLLILIEKKSPWDIKSAFSCNPIKFRIYKSIYHFAFDFFVCSCIILLSSVHIWLVFMANCISMGPTTHESK